VKAIGCKTAHVPVSRPTGQATFQGNAPYWDTEDDPNGTLQAPSVPLYDRASAAVLNPTAGLSSGMVTSKNITSQDSPSAGPPLSLNGKTLGGTMDLVWNLNTYVVAQTTDTEETAPADPTKPANQVYTARAEISWKFDATGNIGTNNFNWSSAQNPPGAGITITSPTNLWQPLTSGYQPVIGTPTTRFNYVLRNQAFQNSGY